MSEPVQVHIADIDFPAFYAAAAGSLDAARTLYDSVSYTGREEDRTAKIILHQAGRMVWLADQIDVVARGRPALQILFFMIAAEAVAKLAAGFEEEGQSRRYVRQFFTTYCTAAQRQRLHDALQAVVPAPLAPDEVADYLYEIRCEVVHRGRYFDVLLSQGDAPMREVRALVLEGAVQAAKEVANGRRI